MSDKAEPTIAIDSELVRTLASLLAETGLSEIEYAVGDRRIRVARNAVAVSHATHASVAAPGTAGAVSAATEPAPAEHPGAIKAPMVGTVYLAPQPEAPPFVKLGEVVAEGQVVLIIEAMKVMNQIHAPRAGLVTHILVADGDPVEYGQPLMAVE